MVISMLVKSTCRRSNGAVATIGCRVTLGKLPSCCRQHTQFLMGFCIWLIIPGHQKHSLSNDKVCSWPWWPASVWHPFKVATQWAFGTTNSSKSSVSPLGIECRYKALWWITIFCWFHRIIWPSSLEVCSARRVFKSVLFWVFSQSNTALSTGSSLWASAQSIPCICTSVQPAAIHTSCSKSWSLSTTAGLWTSTQCAVPNLLHQGLMSPCQDPVRWQLGSVIHHSVITSFLVF